MIKYVEVNGKQMPAIVLDVVADIADVRELRKALINVMEACVSTETNKQFTKAVSLWFLTRLIDETTIDGPIMKGGDV